MVYFFGLFNYEKEGPGISKNAPKKKTFIVFFETFFRNFWKFITISAESDSITCLTFTFNYLKNYFIFVYLGVSTVILQ